jgi:anti-sigma factor RsiW
MAHIEEGILQAYLDDEVVARAELDSHLAQCTTCAAELDRLRAASELFASVIHAADTVASTPAAFAEVKAARRSTARQPGVTVPRVPLARAAMLLLGLAAAASATIPGSPVRAWISEALRSVGGSQQEEVAAPAVQPVPAPAIPNASGAAAVSIEPVDGRVLVVLSGAAAQADVQVRIVQTERASVQVTDAAAQARFRTGAGRIEVIGIGSGNVMVEIPAAALEAVVEVDGRRIFEKNGDQIQR